MLFDYEVNKNSLNSDYDINEGTDSDDSNVNVNFTDSSGGLRKDLDYAENSVCKIILDEEEKNTGTGFLLKIQDPEKEGEKIIVLISCYHVINIKESGGKFYKKEANLIDDNKDNNNELEFITIKHSFNENNKRKLYLYNRRIWYDEDIDFIVIEIKKQECKIEEKFLYTYDNFDINELKKDPESGSCFPDLEIKLCYYLEAIDLNKGYPTSIDQGNKKISYNIKSKPGYSGAPIVCNGKHIIAIHSEKIGSSNIRRGILLKYIINNMKKKYYCINNNQVMTEM